MSSVYLVGALGETAYSLPHEPDSLMGSFLTFFWGLALAFVWIVLAAWWSRRGAWKQLVVDRLSSTMLLGDHVA